MAMVSGQPMPQQAPKTVLSSPTDQNDQPNRRSFWTLSIAFASYASLNSNHYCRKAGWRPAFAVISFQNGSFLGHHRRCIDHLRPSSALASAVATLPSAYHHLEGDIWANRSTD
jgi:hypothetical protein